MTRPDPLLRRRARAEAPPVERAHTAAGKGCPFCQHRPLDYYYDGYWECDNCGEMGFAEIVTGLPWMWARLEQPAAWEPR